MSIQLGDVLATEESIVTPTFTAPITGTQVWVADHSSVERRLPVWAIVLAIVFFPLGVLLLFVREPAYGGYMQINIINGDESYLTTVSTRTHFAVRDVYALASAIRKLAE